MDFTVEIYKGYGIDHDLFDMGEYSVQYCGDDCLFPTLESARAFIDEVTNN